MNEPKYISQRTQLQKQIRLQRRIRLEHSPSMDVVFVAASSTGNGCGIRSVVEDNHAYSEGLRMSPEEYEIKPQPQNIENDILIKKTPEPQPVPIEDTTINSPIYRIRRSYDNLFLLPELKYTEKKETEIVDVKQDAPSESSEEDISFPSSEHQEPEPPYSLPNESCIYIVLDNHNHKWKRKLVYIGCTTVVCGCIAIIVILSLIFTNTSIYTPVLPTTSSNPTLLPNTTTINDHKVTISGVYVIERSNTNYLLIKFKGDGCIQFTETVTSQVLLVGGGGGVGWGGGFLGIGPGTGGGGGGGVGEGTLTFLAGEMYTINVGIGGIERHNNIGNNGGDTSIQGKGILEYAHGGGIGGYYFRGSHYGGSSGGNYGFTGYVTIPNIQQTLYFNNTLPGKATRGNGTLTYHGYPGGKGPQPDNSLSQFNSGSGGGGAGGPGYVSQKNEGGQGGPGYRWSITQEYYGAGGGGGGGCTSCIGGIGGIGGGGGGGGGNDMGGTVPLPNSGGGGGGGATTGFGSGTSGASGIVVIAL